VIRFTDGMGFFRIDYQSGLMSFHGIQTSFAELCAGSPPVFDPLNIQLIFSPTGTLHALITAEDYLMFNHRPRIVEFAAMSRLPAIYGLREFVDSGGLMSYGTDRRDLYRRCATYVHRILTGTRPADLPVERPVKFELAINLKTARVLGLTIPPALLRRADYIVH